MATDRPVRGGWWTVLVAGAALAVRLAYVVPQAGLLERDPDGYARIADHVAHGRGFSSDGRCPTAHRPPLYPLILAGLDRLGGTSTALGVLHALMGAVTVALVFAAGCALGSRTGAGVAAALTALDPLLVHNTALRMTETPAALLVAAAVCLLAHLPRAPTLPRGLALGLVLGLAVLCRPSLALLLVAVLAVALLGRSARTVLTVPVLTGLVVGVAVCEAPWVVRNVASLGHPVWGTTHGGHTLHRGNNLFFYRDAVAHPYDTLWPDDSYQRWKARTDGQAVGLDEVERDRFEYRQAWRFMCDHPRAMLACSWRKLRRFWAVQPNPMQAGAGARVAIGVFYAIQIPLFLVGLCFGRGPRWFRLVVLVTVLCLGLTHALYWSNMRMRAPLVPALALLAGLGLAALVRDEAMPDG